MRRRWWLEGAVALLLACAVILVGFGDEAGHEGDVAGRAAVYAGRIGLRLPTEARVEFADYMHGIDDNARIAFIVPDGAWAAFRAGLPPNPFEADDNLRFRPGVRGWAPGRAPDLTSAQFEWTGAGGGREVLNVGVAPAGPGERRVFVFWHQL